MTTAVQHRRGTTAEHSTFTGLEGEVTIDTTKDTAVIHDGSLAGGYPLAKETLANVNPSTLSAITGAATASDDLFLMYDTSALAMKKISRAELNNAIEVDVLSNVSITGGTINGTTIGGTTAAAGLFTTLSASGNVTLSGGTANGVAYLNGSKVLTSGSALTFDGTTLTAIANGFSSALTVKNSTTSQGVTAKFQNDAASGLVITSYGSTYAAGSILSVGAGGSALDVSTDFGLNAANTMRFGLGYTERMRLTSTGLGIGTSSPTLKLDVNGSAKFAGNYVSFNDTGYIRTDAPTIMRFQHGNGGYEFRNAGNSDNLLKLDSSGNLGLGVTPSAWGGFTTALEFNYNGTISTGDDASRQRISIGSNFYETSSGVYKYRTTSSTIPASMYMQRDAVHSWHTAPSGTAGNAITFTERANIGQTEMVINDPGNDYDFRVESDTNTHALFLRGSDGNVGIGTSSPSHQLDVVSANVTPFRVKRSGAGGGAAIRIENGDSNYYDIFNDGAENLQITYNGTERARIDSSGNLLVGTTSNSTTSGDGFKVNVNVASSGHCDPAVVTPQNTSSYSCWDIYSTNTSSYRFYVTTSGVVNAVSTSISAISDIRFKENIQDLDVGLNKIMALKPRKFDWKAGKGKDIKGDRGFIAQEFEQVFPDLIDEWRDPAPEGEDPYKSVRQDLIPVLVKAIQEQQAIIESLKARLDAANI